MEAQFNDLCRRMLRFDKPVEEPVEESEREEVEKVQTVEEKPKMSRSERRAQEQKEKKKQRKEQAKVKKDVASKGSTLDDAKVQFRLSQFDENDKSRIEKILFNK